MDISPLSSRSPDEVVVPPHFVGEPATVPKSFILSLQTRNDSLKLMVFEERRQKNEFAQLLEATKAEIAASQRGREAMERELEESKRGREAMERELEESRRGRETLERELEESRRGREALERTLADTKRELESTKRELAELKVTMVQILTQMAAFCEQREADRAAAREQHARLEGDVEALKGFIELRLRLADRTD